MCSGRGHELGELLGGNAVVGHLQLVHPAGLLQVHQGGDEVHGILGVLLAHGLGHVDEAVVQLGAVLHEVGVVALLTMMRPSPWAMAG